MRTASACFCRLESREVELVKQMELRLALRERLETPEDCE